MPKKAVPPSPNSRANSQAKAATPLKVVNAASKDGGTAFVCAALVEHESVMFLLIDH